MEERLQDKKDCEMHLVRRLLVNGLRVYKSVNYKVSTGLFARLVVGLISQCTNLIIKNGIAIFKS